MSTGISYPLVSNNLCILHTTNISGKARELNKIQVYIKKTGQKERVTTAFTNAKKLYVTSLLEAHNNSRT